MINFIVEYLYLQKVDQINLDIQYVDHNQFRYTIRRIIINLYLHQK